MVWWCHFKLKRELCAKYILEGLAACEYVFREVLVLMALAISWVSAKGTFQLRSSFSYWWLEMENLRDVRV